MKTFAHIKPKLKKCLPILLMAVSPFVTAYIIILGIQLVSQAAQGDAKLVFAPETFEKATNEVVAVPVYLLPENNNVVGVDVILDFDPVLLEATSVAKNTASGFETFLSDINNTDGTVEFSALAYSSGDPGAPTNPVGGTNAVLIATVSFKTLSAGNTKVTFVFDSYGSKNDSNVVIISGGQILDKLEQPTTQVSFTHKGCNTSNQCVDVAGIGNKGCSIDSDCVPASHKECNSGACVSVSGSGSNACSVTADCTHKVCNTSNQCVINNTPGTDECSSNPDCVPPSHKECNSGSCVSVSGSGSNACSVDADCKHKVCNTSNQCVVENTPGTDECSVALDCAPTSQSIVITSFMQSKARNNCGGAAEFSIKLGSDYMVQDLLKTLSREGGVVINVSDYNLTEGTSYDFYLKGYQHLARKVTAEYDDGMTIDFEEMLTGDVYLDISNPASQDGGVNTLDFDTLASEGIYLSNVNEYDLSGDGEINGFDLAFIIDNYTMSDEE